MSLRRETPCDFGPCPYDSETNNSCEYWCGADEPEDNPAEWEFGCLIPFPKEADPDFWIDTTEEEQDHDENAEWQVESL